MGWLPFALALGGSDRLPVVLPQGDYDQSKTKVLHLSLNPAGAARQRLREDQQQLREECERLRELVRALEAGGPVPAHLEAAAGLPSSREVAGRPRSFHPSLRPAVQELGHGPPGVGALVCRVSAVRSRGGISPTREQVNTIYQRVCVH